MDDYNLDDEFELMKNLMAQTTDNLNRMILCQKRLHIQYGENSKFEEFEQAMWDTVHGWISSNC